MAVAQYEEFGNEEQFVVRSPSGGEFKVLTEAEVAYYEDRVQRYMQDLRFDSVTDLQDLDRVLTMELLCWRWGLWLSLEQDYWGNNVDLDGLKRNLGEFSKELRLLKKMLGIDKATRERTLGESIPEYLENLRRRAKEFGVYREEQLTKALTLFKELQSLYVLFRNCDKREQQENDIEAEDLLKWIGEVAIPEMEQIEDHFANNSHKYWVQEL